MFQMKSGGAMGEREERKRAKEHVCHRISCPWSVLCVVSMCPQDNSPSLPEGLKGSRDVSSKQTGARESSFRQQVELCSIR